MWEQILEYWRVFVDLFDRYVIGVISEMKFVDFIDIVILSIILFYVYKFICQRRAVRLARGLLIVIVVMLLSVIFNMRALNFILENFFQVGMIALIIIFQSDLRAALERFGSTKIASFRGISESDVKAIVFTAETLSEAADALSKNKTGALIVVERSTKLGEYLSHGIILNAEMSSLLIRNVFFDKAPMHDGAMIIRERRIYAAGCYLPLSNADVNKDLGTRHRAALGLSEVSDAVVIVVSEETGIISIAVDGELIRGFNFETLKNELIKYMMPQDNLKRSNNDKPKKQRISNKNRKKGGERNE